MQLVRDGLTTLEEAYGTFNMGAGFAVYVPEEQASATINAARACGIPAWRGGSVAEEAGRKAVDILPLGISFAEDSLNLR